ncbi:MAG: hypothetical protein KC586_20920, partial [Myxococcales bacterium]|nr:hypothetical protein [Myxococcales bacterium]
ETTSGASSSGEQNLAGVAVGAFARSARRRDWNGRIVIGGGRGIGGDLGVVGVAVGHTSGETRGVPVVFGNGDGDGDGDDASRPRRFATTSSETEMALLATATDTATDAATDTGTHTNTDTGTGTDTDTDTDTGTDTATGPNVTSP